MFPIQYTIATYYPRVAGILHNKFHLDRLSGWITPNFTSTGSAGGLHQVLLYWLSGWITPSSPRQAQRVDHTKFTSTGLVGGSHQVHLDRLSGWITPSSPRQAQRVDHTKFTSSGSAGGAPRRDVDTDRPTDRAFLIIRLCIHCLTGYVHQSVCL